MPFPLLVPGALAAVASGTTAGAGVATGAGVAAAVGTGATVGTGTAIAAGGGGFASIWLFIKNLFHIGSVTGTGTAAVGTGVAVKAVATKVVAAKVVTAKAAVGKVVASKVIAGKAAASKAIAGKAAAGKVAAGKTVAGKTAAGKVAAGKTAAVPQQGMSNMIYTDDPFLPPIPLPNPLPHLPPLDPVNKAYLDGALTGATIVGITGATVALSKSSNENNNTPNTVIPDTEPPNTANNNSSPVTENDRRRRRQNQRPEPFPENTCAICLEEMSDVNNIVVNCGHRFHADCFLNYSRSQNTSVVCPVCRESDIM